MRKKNITLQNVAVEDYAAEGKALARVDGKVIFIEGAVPGDIVDVRLGKNKKDWAEGKVTLVHQYGADRVDPFCEHFGVCGGCKWQMLPYKKQLFYKQQEVEQHLKRIGKITLPAIQPILGCEQNRFYRNKLEFTCSNRRYLLPGEVDSDAEIVQSNAIGFHVPKLFDKVIDIFSCHLMQEPANLIRNTIRDYALAHGLTYYDIREHHGFLRTVIVRVLTTGEVMVNLVFGKEDRKAREALLNHLLEKVKGITTLLYTINQKWNDSIFDQDVVTYYGKGYALEKLGRFQFKIGPKSFFQTNTRQGEKLYGVARDFAELTGRETVYDLYCGTGSIGIFLSDQLGKLVGVEMIADAITNARENANMNGITNASFFAGDVIDICGDDFFAQHGRPDVVITDPPRAGMHELLVQKLLQMEAPLMVYVSCNVATQARDLNLLDTKYEVTKVQPVDMFPHTHHIENVVQLKLRK
jgi:23S rRNA (uracil1939-C5)-methyltransferase